MDGHLDKWSSELVIEAAETMKQSKQMQRWRALGWEEGLGDA